MTRAFGLGCVAAVECVVRAARVDLVFITLVVVLHVPHAKADWPQWGGPGRDFRVVDGKLPKQLTSAGVRRHWERKIGDGYSSIAARDGHLFVTYRQQGEEHVESVDAITGRLRWHHHYPAPLLPNTNLEPGEGPQATPLLVDRQVITVGVTGLLRCLNIDSGRVHWQTDLVHDLDGTVLFRGYSPSPIRFEDSVLVPVGGKGHAVVAFRIADGTIKWQRHDFPISHASPLLIDFRGQPQLVILADKVIVGLDPRNGDLLWQHAHPKSGGYVASMPVFGNDRLFFSFAYGGGSRCLQLTKSDAGTSVRELWHNGRMRIHHSNAMLFGGHVYATTGDFGATPYAAIDVETGRIRWQTRSIKRASCLRVGQRFLALEEDGQLTLLQATPAGVETAGRVRLFDGRAWTPPTLIGDRLYVRNRKSLMAFELK